MKKILLLFNKEQLDRINNFSDFSFNVNSVEIYAFTAEIRILLQKKKIPYKTQENFFTEDLSEKFDKKALSITRFLNVNMLNFKGFFFGIALHRYFYFFFVRIIRYIEIFLNIIESEEKLEIIYFEDKNSYIIEYNRILEYICFLKKISLKKIPMKNNIFVKNLSQKNNKIQISIFNRINNSYLNFLILNTLTNLKIITLDIKNFFLRIKSNEKLLYQYKFHKSVVDKLKKNSKYRIFLLDDISNPFENFPRFFFDKEIKICIKQYESKKVKKQARKIYNLYEFKWKSIINKTFFKEALMYNNNISLWEIFNIYFDDILIELFKIIRMILISQNLIKKTKIKLSIFHADARYLPRTLSYFCLKQEIPSLIIQHGITGHHTSFIPSVCNKFAGWGEISKKYLIKHGLESNQVIITGVPRFDQYIKLSNKIELQEIIRKKVYMDFKIDTKNKLIVYATNYNSFYRRDSSHNINNIEIEKIYQLLLKAIKAIPDLHLIIKLHRGDENPEYPLLLKDFFKVSNISVTSDYNIRDLIVSCDCFISGFSTTIIEAMLSKKAVVLINFRECTNTLPINSYNIIDVVSNYGDLLKSIKNSIHTPIVFKRYNSFLEDYIYKLDGLSTQRVLELIDELTSNKKE